MEALVASQTERPPLKAPFPAFGGKWGQPLLLGPGTIHVAHTKDERVPKQQLLEAIELYQRLVIQLQAQEATAQ